MFNPLNYEGLGPKDRALLLLQFKERNVSDLAVQTKIVQEFLDFL